MINFGKTWFSEAETCAERFMSNSNGKSCFSDVFLLILTELPHNIRFNCVYNQTVVEIPCLQKQLQPAKDFLCENYSHIIIQT